MVPAFLCEYVRECFSPPVPPIIGGTQDAKIAKDSFFGFIQILEERFRIWTGPSPNGHLAHFVIPAKAGIHKEGKQ